MEHHPIASEKITADVGGRRDTIMLPAAAFKEALERLIEFEGNL